MPAYVVMLGPPGSGKGTQARRLAEKYGIPHISTGDMFRAMKAEDTPLAWKVRAIMEQGALVPDELTIEMVRERLGRADVRAGAIFDGFPRTTEQADALARLLGEIFGAELDVAFLLDVPEEEILRRIGQRAQIEGRADDSGEVVHRRHQTYLEQTAPLIEYYRDRDKLVEVDGARPVEAITEELEARLEPFFTTSG